MARVYKSPKKCECCGQRLNMEKRLCSLEAYNSYLYNRIAGLERNIDRLVRRRVKSIIGVTRQKRLEFLRKIEENINFDRTKLIQEQNPGTTFPNLQIIFDTNFLGNINAEKYVSMLYKGDGWIIKKYNYEYGHPDLIFSKGRDTLYVEVKRNQDTWRRNQIEWYMKNKEKRYILYYVQDLDYPSVYATHDSPKVDGLGFVATEGESG